MGCHSLICVTALCIKEILLPIRNAELHVPLLVVWRKYMYYACTIYLLIVWRTRAVTQPLSSCHISPIVIPVRSDTNKIGWVLTLTVTTRLDFTSLGRGLKESPTLPYSRPQLTAAICTHCQSEESGTDREKDRECRYVGKRSQKKQRGLNVSRHTEKLGQHRSVSCCKGATGWYGYVLDREGGESACWLYRQRVRFDW